MTTELVGRRLVNPSTGLPYTKKAYLAMRQRQKEKREKMASHRKPTTTLERLTKDAIDNCELFVDGGQLRGICSFPTPDGFARFGVSVPLRPIQRVLMHELQNRAAVEGVGWGWSSIKKAFKKVKKIAKKIAKSKIIRKIKKVLKSPIIAKAMKAVSVIYPPAGVAYAAVKNATKLVNKAVKGSKAAIGQIAAIKKLAGKGNAKAATLVNIMSKFYAVKKLDVAKKANNLLKKVTDGDQQSRQNFLRIADLALGGNKFASNIVELMRHMYVIKKKNPKIGEKELIEISGWFYNKEYRSPLQAGELDPSNPFTMLRHGYYAGSQLIRQRAGEINQQKEAEKSGSQIILEQAA